MECARRELLWKDGAEITRDGDLTWRGTSKVICSRSGALVHGPSAGFLTACLSDRYLGTSFCLATAFILPSSICLEALLQRPRAPGGEIAVCLIFRAHPSSST